ncbi:18514_t:CDS:10 [Dentiscutata erythropus]|uniref:18514_t:CDS:1 n=1 Tax=Dentiscutata erythropus TaxID=1348616 RepID=A0A9N9FSW3_9GLOM|nr:18514_t:CDS:10 [Dentiscutata erythropus]
MFYKNYILSTFFASRPRKLSSASLLAFRNSKLHAYSSSLAEQENELYNSMDHLRPYQRECIETCLHKFLKEKVNRQIVSLPVGSGKTVIFSNLIHRIPSPMHGAEKILVLAHREELLDQAYKQIKKYSNLTAEIDQGERTATGNANVVIGSVQTLGRTGSARIEKYDPSQFKAIVIDEAHHAAASTYLRRYDGLALDGIFDEITYHKDFLEMIKEKWLCNLRVTTIRTGTDLSRVKSNAIDFVPTILSKLVNVKNRNEIIVRTYLKFAENRKSTLVFGVDIDHVENLTETFREYGINAYGITSKTKAYQRAEILNNFRAKLFPVLVNCGILTEGMDVPTIDCVIMSRPTKSHVLFQQMIGRGMRTAEDKEDCLVLDFIDSYYKIPDLITAPTLFGLDPTTELNDYIPSIGENKENIKVEQKTREYVVDITKIKITEYNNPFEIIEDCSGATFIGTISDFAWLRVSHDIYVLPLYEVGTLRVEKDIQGVYHVKLRKKQNRFINNTSVCVHVLEDLPIRSDSLESVIHVCDQWVIRTSNKRGRHIRDIALRYAKWRREPITQQQIQWLKKKKVSLNDDAIKSINRGQATNLVARIIEGAQKNWRLILNERAAKEKIRLKKEAQKVRVGSLKRPLD